MLPSFLIPLIGVMVVVFIAFYGFTTRGYMIHGLLLAAPVMLFMVNRPEVLMMTIIGIYQSNFIVPGLPGGIQLVHGLMLFFVGLTVAYNIVSKRPRRRLEAIHYFMYLFLAIILVTIYHRGFGLRAAGGDIIGGGAYVRIFAGAGFLFCARYYTLTVEQWKKCVVIIVISSFVPFLAQMLFLLSGGKIYQQFMFVQPYVYGLVTSLISAQEQGGMVRYHGLSAVSVSLLGAALIYMPFRGVKQFKFVIATLTCLSLAMLSGFRLSVLEVLGVSFFFVLYSVPAKDRLRYCTALMAALFAGLLFIFPMIPFLPFSMQRALSWIPYAEVSSMARVDATNSTAWRLEVWEFSLQFWREYAWIGRGLTVKMSEIYSLVHRPDLILEAFYNHNYHSGPISLLLDLGVPGFIVGTLFMIAAAIYTTKPLHPSANPLITRFYNLYRAKTLYAVVGYYLLFGDVKSSFIIISLNLAILESIRVSIDKSASKTKASDSLSVPHKGAVKLPV